MQITLCPQRREGALNVAKMGDALTINGNVYDFTVIPEGATLPASAVDCEYFAGDVQRVGGALHITILLPISGAATEAARFPAPIIDPADGPLELPQ